MDNRVEIIVELTGIQNVKNDLRSLSSLAKQLSREKIDIKLEKIALDRQIADLRRQLTDLQKQKYEAKLEGDTKDIDEAIKHTRQELSDLLDQRRELNIEANVNTEGLRLANEEMNLLIENSERLQSVVESVFGAMANVSGGLGDFASGIGSAFGAMSDVFSNDVTTYVRRSLTYLGTRAVTSRIGDIISRYDIMSTFTDYMELAGVSAEKASESLDKVDQSIRGIPIGLDESAFRLRRYQMYLNDIDRATNLTIGLQRAIIAGGASEQMQTTAYTQIDRLLATGKLGQSRQWISLFNGLGVSLRFLKDELALDPTADMKTIAADLASGRIAADDFLRAIERLAYNDELGQAIEIYKSTISAWMSNIGNAIKRGGQNVLVALNETMNDTFGFGITGVLKGVRDEIDNISTSMGTFIRQNPENLERLSEIFRGLFGIAEGANFGDFVTKFIDRLEELAGIIRTIFDALPDGFLSDFASFAMVLAGPLAKIFATVSSGAGIVLGVFERFRDFDFQELIGKIVDQVERMARVVEGLLRLIPDGLLGDLMAFGLVWGKPLAKVLGGIGGAIGNIVASIRGLQTGKGGTLLSEIILLARSNSAFSGFLGISGFAAGIGAIGFALSSYFNEKTRKGLEILKETAGIDFDEMISGAERATKGILDTLESFDKEAEQIGIKADMIDEVAQRILTTNEKLKTESNDALIAEQKRNFEELQELADIEINYDADTGLILDEDAAVQQLSTDYLNLAKAKQEAEALSGLRNNALTNMIEAQANANVLQDQLRAAQSELDTLRRWQLYHPDRRVFDLDGTQPVESNPYMTADMPEEYEDDYTALAQAAGEAATKVQLLEEKVYEANAAAELATDYYERYGIELGKLNYQITKMEREGITVFDRNGEAKDFAQVDENLQQILASYQQFADGAREAIDEVITGFGAMEAAATVSAEAIKNNLQTQLDYLTNLNTNLGTLMKFVTDNIGTDRGEGAAAALTEIMSDPSAYAGELQGIVDAINTGDMGVLDSIFGTYNDIQAKKDEYTKLVADIKTLLGYGEDGLAAILNNPDLTDGGLMQQIFGDEMYGALVESIRAVTEEYVNDTADMEDATADLIGEMGELKAEAHMVAFEIDAAGRAYENASPKAEGMSTSAAKLAAQLGLAAGAASSLASAINSIPSHKEVQVVYTQTNYGFGGSYRHTSGAMVPMFESKGGMIPQYFSNGRWVNFAPRGTDTVPAMLTPGEFVVRKSAAQMWGKPLLEAINGMDVSGAFKAIWSRAATGTVNNYRDNHAQVIQNFYGNTGQGYSQKFALRAIGGL